MAWAHLRNLAQYGYSPLIRPYRQFTFLKITVDIITLFFNMLQLTRAAVTIDRASVVD